MAACNLPPDPLPGRATAMPLSLLSSFSLSCFQRRAHRAALDKRTPNGVGQLGSWGRGREEKVEGSPAWGSVGEGLENDVRAKCAWDRGETGEKEIVGITRLWA